MKKTFLKFAYVCAIALTGMMGFSACQSDSAEEVNPNYDPETNSVKTEFAFNISSSAKQKMTGANTQQKVEDDGTGFLGMNTMWLYCLAEDPTASSGFLANGQINLGSLGTLAASEISGTKSSKVYSMYLPVGTKNFLFYGSQAGKTHNGKHANGQLNMTFLDAKYDNKSTVGDITFALTPIIEKSESELNTAGNTLKGYLNTILAATAASGKTWKGTQYYLNAPQNNTEVGAQFRELASLYYAFVKKFTQGRQLSAYDTKRSVQDLYNMVIKINANSTNTDVQAIATAVKTAIEANFTPKEVTPATTPETYTLAYKSSAGANVTNFPLEQGLPAGSVVITSNPTDVDLINTDEYSTFDTFTMIISGENSLGQVIASPTNEITYPSELTYYTNSKAVTSTSAHAASDYPKTVVTWDNITTNNWTGATGTWEFPGTVEATTTAAAIRQNIKYGAAQLVSTVKITPNGSGNLIDNAKKITVTNDAYDLLEDKENQEITYADNLFTLNGILVGGQPAQSDWQFLPKSGTTMSRVVYDNVINTNTITQSVTSPYEPTYTLVMDNFKSGSPIPTQDVVNIALEIKNNSGQDFYGADGLIPAGGTFYLVGKLDPTDPTSGSPIDWTGTYDGTANTIGHPGRGTQRVFIQDFKTMVNFTIPSDGLQRAYSSIPDLRSTKLLFGLSVDLTWKTGLTFNVNL